MPDTADVDYSPSETTDYLACPQYRAYRWAPDGTAQVPRELTHRDFAAMVGLAVHAGLAVQWKFRKEYGSEHDGVALAVEAVSHAGEDELARLLQQAQLNSQRWTVDPPTSDRVRDGFQRYCAWEPAWLIDQTVCMVEQTLGPHGGTPDLVLQKDGVVTIVDYKTLWLRDLRYLADRLRAYHTSWQFHDYCWRVGAHVGRPVTRVLVIGFVYLLVKARGEPDRWEVHSIVDEPVVVPENAGHRWEEYAKKQWVEMADHSQSPGRNLTKCNNFGFGSPCEYYEACHGAGMNDVTYTQVARTHKEPR